MNDDTKNATCKQQENFSHKVQSYPLLEEQNASKKLKNSKLLSMLNHCDFSTNSSKFIVTVKIQYIQIYKYMD